MFFPTLINIFGYNNSILIHRGISLVEFNINHKIGSLNFLERVDSDIKLIFSEKKYDALKNKFPDSQIYLVTNNYNYYYNNRHLSYIRYLPLFVSMTNNKNNKEYLNENDIELSYETFLKMADIDKLKPSDFAEIKNKNGDIYLRIAYVAKFLKTKMLSVDNPCDIKFDYNMNSMYRKKLLLIPPEVDSICYSLPFIINLDRMKFYWFKTNTAINEIIDMHFKYFNLNKNDIDDRANTYFVYTLYNTDELKTKIQKNIRECFTIITSIENDIFRDSNSFDEALEILETL